MQRQVAHLLLGMSLLVGLGDSLPAAQPARKSLYERLGGVYSIATVVDDFIERLLVNDTLNANPAISEARRRVPKAGLKFHVTTLVCEVTGGPCKYSGRSMKESHDHLNINEGQWQVDGDRLPQDAREVQGAGEGARRIDHDRGKHEERYCEGIADLGTIALPAPGNGND
jgi:hypothetical protein